MDRWLLNTFPTWALALLVVGGAVAIAVGGFLGMRKLVPSLAAHAESRGLSSAFSIASGLFSFVLAFTIGSLYTNFNHAVGDARQEATAVAQVLRVARGLPAPLAGQIREETLRYAVDVRTREWRLMAQGRVSDAAWEDIEQIFATLERVRDDKSVTGDPFYGQTLGAVDTLVADRQARLDDVNSSVPPLFQVFLFIGALLAIAGTFTFKPFGERLQVVMIGAAAAMIGLALLVAISLDYPYSGSVSVSKAPFATSTLLTVSGDG